MVKTKEKNILIALIIVLIVAIVGVIWFVLLPKYRAQQIPDLSNDAWIERLAEDKITLFEKDFYDACSVIYSPDQVILNVRYFSRAQLLDVREKYKALLNNPSESGENTDFIMNLSGDLNGMDISIQSYFFEMICQIYDLSITLEEGEGELIQELIKNNYPIQVIEDEPILKSLAGDEYGGYVLYNYDEFDQYQYTGIPIYSKAYYYLGTANEFDTAAAELGKKHESSIWNQAQHTLDYRDGNNNIKLAYIEGQRGNLVMINVQTAEMKK